MTLSDEDYGILYNAIAQTPHNFGTHFASSRAKHETWEIVKNYESIPYSTVSNSPSYQQLLDFASFIILSEGRELP